MLGIDLGIGAGEDFPRIEFGLLCLFTLVAVAVGVAALRRSALGSAMLAVRANERSAAAVGVNVVRVKVLAFALASFIAGLGGSLLAYRRGVVTFDSFTAIGGLALLSTAYLAGVTSVWGGINAGILASTGIVFIALDRWVDLGDVVPGHHRRAAGRHADRPPGGHRQRGPPARRPRRPLAGRSASHGRRRRGPGGRRRCAGGGGRRATAGCRARPGASSCGGNGPRPAGREPEGPLRRRRGRRRRVAARRTAGGSSG